MSAHILKSHIQRAKKKRKKENTENYAAGK